MVTIDRAQGCRVIINTDDHSPPHVHIERNGRWVRIEISEAPMIRGATKMGERDLLISLRLVESNWMRYLERWERMHG